MATKRSVVTRSEVERARRRTLVGSGTAPARTRTQARILLQTNHGEVGPGWTDVAVASAVAVHPATVARVRQQSVTAGLDAVLTRTLPDRADRRTVDGAQEAHLVARACSSAPAGRQRGTLRLLAAPLVGRDDVDAVSHEPVRQTGKQPRSHRG